MKALRTLLLLALLPLGGCLTAKEAGEVVDRINARIATVDEVVHKLCPSLAVINASAERAACVAKANGTTQRVLARVSTYGAAFCSNPTSASLAELTRNASSGLRAALLADTSGCAGP